MKPSLNLKMLQKTFYSILLCAVLIHPLCAQPTDNVIAYYPFNGNANDVTINKKHGNATRVTLTADRLGKPNAAYSYNGTNSLIYLPNYLFPNNTAFSFSLWFKFSGTVLRPADYAEVLIDFRGQYNFSMGYLQYNHPTNPKTVNFNIANSTASINCFTPNYSIQDAIWYHVVATYANNTMQLYLNGVLMDTKTHTPPNVVSGYNNAIGKDYNMNRDRLWFNGIIDEVILYKRGLNAAEVLALYNRGLTSSDFTELFATQEINFSYDEMGNRTRHNVVTLKSTPFINTTDSAGFNYFDPNSPDDKFEDNLGNKKITIYPNPTKGQLLVEIQGYEKESASSLYLYNLSGKLLKTVSPANANVPLDLSQYPAGVYILKIKLGEAVSEWKIIKE